MSRMKAPEQRVRRGAPVHGEVQSAVAVGWQHGENPTPPDGLMPASVAAWDTWFGSWVAAFWSPSDVPGLGLFDQVQRGEFQRHTEVRLMMDTYGITPKG